MQQHVKHRMISLKKKKQYFAEKLCVCWLTKRKARVGPARSIIMTEGFKWPIMYVCISMENLLINSGNKR